MLEIILHIKSNFLHAIKIMFILLLIIIYLFIKNIIKLALIIELLKKEKYFKGRNVDYFDGHTFQSLHKNTDQKVSFKELWKFFVSNRTKWSNVEFTHIDVSKHIYDDNIHISYINHCTFLLQTKEYNIITDPVFSKKAGPYNLLGVKRAHEVPVEICNLPKIDYILLSHNHYDHMDIASIKQICKRDNSLIITPAGNDYILRKYNKQLKTCALLWGDALYIKKHDIKFIVEKAYHWSKRNLFDKNKALWGSFVIQAKGKQIFFSGDTAWAHNGKIFEDIYNKYGKMNLCFLPIGSYSPRHLLKQAHVNPEESVLIHKILHSELTLSMHHGTFCLSQESYDQPFIDLEEAKIKHSVAHPDFIGIKPGYQTIYK